MEAVRFGKSFAKFNRLKIEIVYQF